MVVKCKSGAEMQQQPRAGPGRGCTGPAEEKLHIKIKWLQQWRMHQSCILMLHISKIFFVVRIYHKSKPRHMLVYKSKPKVYWHYNMSSPGSSCPAVRARCWSQCWGRPGAGARQCRPAQHLCVHSSLCVIVKRWWNQVQVMWAISASDTAAGECEAAHSSWWPLNCPHRI